jgi:FixJ family two-component response regulator
VMRRRHQPVLNRYQSIMENRLKPHQLRRVRSDRKVPIVFITSRADKHIRAQVLEAGAVAYLLKPFTETALLDVDDDVSVRESLELLIRNAGWQPELLASAQEFLARPRVVAPSCLVLDVTLPGLSGLELKSASLPIGRTCPSSSSRVMATCR